MEITVERLKDYQDYMNEFMRLTNLNKKFNKADLRREYRINNNVNKIMVDLGYVESYGEKAGVKYKFYRKDKFEPKHARTVLVKLSKLFEENNRKTKAVDTKKPEKAQSQEMSNKAPAPKKQEDVETTTLPLGKPLIIKKKVTIERRWRKKVVTEEFTYSNKL